MPSWRGWTTCAATTSAGRPPPARPRAAPRGAAPGARRSSSRRGSARPGSGGVAVNFLSGRHATHEPSPGERHCGTATRLAHDRDCTTVR